LANCLAAQALLLFVAVLGGIQTVSAVHRRITLASYPPFLSSIPSARLYAFCLLGRSGSEGLHLAGGVAPAGFRYEEFLV
jgi:hypothetical protein